MTATRRGGGFGRSAGDAALRGALLVAVAVILGAVLIWRGNADGSPETIVAGANVTAGDKTTTTKPKSGGNTTTTAPATTVVLKPKERVKVIVANGVGTSKPRYAGSVKTLLVTKTWAVQGAFDAKVGQQSTQIFYADGYLNEAKELAKDLGTDIAPTLVPVDLTAYLNPDGIAAAASSNIVVILGLDDKVKV